MVQHKTVHTFFNKALFNCKGVKSAMNADSEQLTIDKSIHIAQDQPLTQNQIFEWLQNILGAENCSKESYDYNKKVFKYKHNGRVYILLTRSITYLGNPHPIFKKRVQLPNWFQTYCNETAHTHPDYDVRFIGVYHYNGNVIFVDFKKDTYLQHGLHNSSAHVYVNDLYQGMTYGVYEKEDQLGNTIVSIRCSKFKKYLQQEDVSSNNLFELFRQFNNGYPFGKWLYSCDMIREMHDNGWKQWRQAEWAGWFLEYRFDQFTKINGVVDKMCYIGNKNKGADELDFDIFFEEENFYGDLKASDVSKKETPGNDQENFIECIYRHDKFWYVIYEHETISDKDKQFEATQERNAYLNQIDKNRDKDLFSYKNRMKHSVKFVKMSIVELNRVNFREALQNFNQGRQPNGAARAPKFIINKSNIDNFVVFRYNYVQHENI